MEKERESGGSGPSGSILKPSEPSREDRLDWEGANKTSRVAPAEGVGGGRPGPASSWHAVSGSSARCGRQSGPLGPARPARTHRGATQARSPTRP